MSYSNRLRGLLALGSLFAFPFGASAVTFTWTGAANNNWSTSATDFNWNSAWSNSLDRSSPNAAIFNLPSSSTVTIASNIDVANIAFDSSGWSLNSGGGVLAFGGTGTLNVITPFGNDSINAVISNGSTFGTGGGTTSLSKVGPGTLSLGGANTYTGTTTVNNGTLRLDGSTGSLNGSTGTFLVLTGGTFLYDNTTSSGAKSQAMNVYVSFAGGDSTIQNIKGGASSSTLSLSSQFSIFAGATGNFISGGSSDTANSIRFAGLVGFLSGALFFNGANYAFGDASRVFVRAPVYGVDPDFANAVDGSSLLSSSSINYRVATTSIASQATVSIKSIKFDGAGAIDMTLATDAVLSSGSGGFLRAGGGSTAINGNGASKIQTTSPAAGFIFRVDSANDTLTLNVPIVDNGTNPFAKSGQGTLFMGQMAVNTFKGNVFINGGILSILQNSNLGNETTGATLNINNGTLQAAASFGLFHDVAGTKNRNLILTNDGNIAVTASNSLTLAGIVSGSGRLLKTGTGTLLLNNSANSYTGGTLITDGTLLVSNTTGTATGLGSVTLDGGKLAGSGAIAGSVLAGSSSHTVAPAGTLTLGFLTTNDQTTLAFNLVNPAASDALNITSNNGLTINNASITLTDNNAPQGYYKLIQYNGTIQGTGAASLAIATPAPQNMAYFLDTAHDPGFIDLHKVLIGDINADNIVDGADFDTWFSHIGSNSPTYDTGDLNNDHQIDGADFDLWFTHLLNTTTQSDNSLFTIPNSSLNPVPEPASLALLLPFLLMRRRKRNIRS